VTAEAGGLALNQTVDGLKAKGVEFDPARLSGTAPALLVPAETAQGPAYRVGFKNFEVITRYNRSVRYAMAVHDLSQAIAVRVAAADAAGRDTTSQLAARKLALDEDSHTR
jgi:membrane-bound lytic murein transglycosylase B